MTGLGEDSRPQQIPARWSTDRLIVRNATLSEADELQKIYETGAYLAPRTGHAFEPECIHRLLTVGDLPSGGTKERFRFQSICVKDGGEATGLLELYHGYPDRGTLWIADLFIRPLDQKRGYGREICSILFDLALQAAYSKTGVGVHLKNCQPSGSGSVWVLIASPRSVVTADTATQRSL